LKLTTLFSSPSSTGGPAIAGGRGCPVTSGGGGAPAGNRCGVGGAIKMIN